MLTFINFCSTLLLGGVMYFTVEWGTGNARLAFALTAGFGYVAGFMNARMIRRIQDGSRNR